MIVPVGDGPNKKPRKLLITATGANHNRAFARLRPSTPQSKRKPPAMEGFRMACRMSIEKRNTILRLLVEGNSIRSVTRLMGTNIPTVLRQLVWAGEHCRELMDANFQGLTLDHLEVDEMYTFVAKKQARLTVEEKAER